MMRMIKLHMSAQYSTIKNRTEFMGFPMHGLLLIMGGPMQKPYEKKKGLSYIYIYILRRDCVSKSNYGTKTKSDNRFINLLTITTYHKLNVKKKKKP